MAEYEEKFLVINFKRFRELNDNTKFSNCNCREAACPHEPKFLQDAKEIKGLLNSIKKFKRAYGNRVGKELNQKYYVCNQDEPYAQRVIDIILKGEENKDIDTLANFKSKKKRIINKL